MGMLMHHTWLKQQEEAEKRKKAVILDDPVEEPDEYDVPVKKTVVRRKASRK